jgi:alkylation response protein AidB-like acyl-CoA dehydrogenase
MLSFTPTEEQQMLINTVRRYAENDLQPGAHERDELSSTPHELILKGWEIGLLPASIPEEWGGFGDYSAVSNVLALEELAFGDLSAAIKLLVPSLFAYPVLWGGTDEQKARFLPLFCEEKPYPATAALIEPSVLFDPLNMKTTVTREDDCYIINGTKAYVPLADGAQWIIVYAQDTESGQIDGYLVEAGAVDGVEITAREKLMGLRALDSHRLNFSNVRVDAANKLGTEPVFQQILDHSQVGLAALAVGVARASHEYALAYAKDRVQFGKPIATKQAIAFLLAECRIEIDAARLLAWEAAWQMDNGNPAEEITRAAYLARHYADQTVLYVTDNGVQALGGHGFIREHPVERYLRNGRGFPTFTGLALA